MNEFLKRVRKEIRRGVTVEGKHGAGFIVASGAKFATDKTWHNRFYIRLSGVAFDGRVFITQNAVLPGKPETYSVRFKQRGGYKYYHTVKFLKDVDPSQLTAVLDAYINGTGTVGVA